MQELPEKIDSKFRFVLLASKRAEQIMRGAQSKVSIPGAKHTRLGMQEIFDTAVGWDYGPEEVDDAVLATDDDADDGESSEAAAEAEES